MSFDGVAPWYRMLETIVFGGALQRARVACLGEIGTPHRALIVGEGNGRFLCELLRLYPGLEVVCVDASARMLQLARQRIHRGVPETANRINFLQRDITSWSPLEQHFDLIVTHFVLDCFPENRVSEIVTKLSAAGTRDATWLLADFCVPPGAFARRRTALWLAAMYSFFRVTARIEATELKDPSPFLRKEGFALDKEHLFRGGMIKSELWRRSV